MRRGATLRREDYDDRTVARFHQSYVVTESGCWEWARSLVRDGYGSFTWGPWLERRAAQAHRVSFCLRHGETPGDMYCLHSCDNRRCVNPDHLRMGTQSDNMRDMVERHRDAGWRQIKTHCKRGHPMDGPQMYYWKGRRQCGACMRIARLARLARASTAAA